MVVQYVKPPSAWSADRTSHAEKVDQDDHKPKDYDERIWIDVSGTGPK
jgi:hypothetical protein